MQDKEYRINDNLPESLNTDNMHELAKTVDEALRKINALSEIVNLYPHIDELSSRLVDALAIQFHCDVYDTSLPLDIRRQIVKKSVPWHIRKGTAAVVEEVVATIFGTGASVEEWFQYGGNPYCFRVTVENANITRESVLDMRRAIDRMKNVRSWLDTLKFTFNLEDDESGNIEDASLLATSLFALQDDVPYGAPINAYKHDGTLKRAGTLNRDRMLRHDGSMDRRGFSLDGTPRWGKHLDYIFRADGRSERNGMLQRDGRCNRSGEKPWKIEYVDQMEEFSVLVITLARDGAATFEDDLKGLLPRSGIIGRDGSGRHGRVNHPVDTDGSLTITRTRQRNGRIQRNGGDINLHDGSMRRSGMFRRDGGGIKRRVDIISDRLSGAQSIARGKKEAPLYLKHPELYDTYAGAEERAAEETLLLEGFADDTVQHLLRGGNVQRTGSYTRGADRQTVYESGGIEIIHCKIRDGSIDRAGGWTLKRDSSLRHSGESTHDKGGNRRDTTRHLETL